MKIPERLLKLSQKEREKELNNKSVFTTKYIINEDYIYEIEEKTKRHIHLTDGSKYTSKELQEYFTPLTEEKYRYFIRNNIINVNEWDYKRFKNWCIKQFIDAYGIDYVYSVDSYVYVWFPEVTIKNSVEQEHTMYDIYLKFYIYDDYVKLSGLLRGTLSDAEIANNYQFSHVNTGSVFNWSNNFCFGYTEIKDLKDEVESNRTRVFKNLRFFLEALKEYLSWESLEGTPYYHIESVIQNKATWKKAPPIDFDKDKCYNYLKKNLKSFTYDFIETDGNYQIKLSLTSIEEITNILTEDFPDKLQYNLNGASVQKKVQYLLPEERKTHIFFKNEWRPLKIIQSNTSILPMKIASNILFYVTIRLEKEFSQFLINKNAKNLFSTRSTEESSS